MIVINCLAKCISSPAKIVTYSLEVLSKLHVCVLKMWKRGLLWVGNSTCRLLCHRDRSMASFQADTLRISYYYTNMYEKIFKNNDKIYL